MKKLSVAQEQNKEYLYNRNKNQNGYGYNHITHKKEAEVILFNLESVDC